MRDDGTIGAMTARPPLILASTSRYRRELLARLRVPFEAAAPQVDETPRGGELPAALARRLAMAKARDVAMRYPDAVVIGSDQVAELEGRTMGKPLTHVRAVEQLRAMSGRSVVFHTALAVVRRATDFSREALVPATARFRALTDAEIEHYLKTEQPYDCAGAAKIETLGIALLESLACEDQTALIGLPLLRTCDLLRAAGIDPLMPATVP